MLDRFLARAAAMLLVAIAAQLPGTAGAAGHRTANFLIEAPTEGLARKIGEAAEQYRHDLAVEWLGRPLPRWSRPCPVKAQVAPHLGAGGATSFVFDAGEVFGWTMTIQGSEERILDSVLPHEVTHTIFATHFRRPLPRWADEGACTTVEHPVERARQHRLLIEHLTTGRGIAFPQMFAMREYPADVLPLYSQGYSLARYLIERGGRHRYVAFVGDGLASDDWTGALHRHYGVPGIAQLQHTWLDWVRQGCPAPPASLVAAQSLAAQSLAAQAPAAAGVARGQSPDPVPTAPAAALAALPTVPRGPAPPSDGPGTPARPVAAPGGGRRSIYALQARRPAGEPPIDDTPLPRLVPIDAPAHLPQAP